MAAAHGTRRRYINGCRCEDCTESNRLYFRQRRASPCVADLPHMEPGPVESGVENEIAGLAEVRPGLAQMALDLARVLDNPRATNQKPAAAKVLAALLDKLHAASAQRRPGNLAVVRTMTAKGGA